uniref:Uncharacterized protein n=1 Tax=virus sp. ct5rm7 TaxID=2827298 RepID=A0A8S5RGK2_9VIRU|nr:MAG TPA: hypothetical protein [virus sp. ct5rm7]
MSLKLRHFQDLTRVKRKRSRFTWALLIYLLGR